MTKYITTSEAMSMGFFGTLEADALISKCGLYRYLLWRIWDKRKPMLIFCGLNPSTADHKQDDATIRWLKGYALKHGYGGILVVNLFAWRATQPKDMLAARHPIQEPGKTINDQTIIEIATTPRSVFVAGWGAQGTYLSRDRAVGRLLRQHGARLHALAFNKDGSPHHPRGLSHSLDLKEMEAAI